MKLTCPYCDSWTEVVDTRVREGGRHRRYQCGNDHRFNTLEQIVLPKTDRRVNERNLSNSLHDLHIA